MILYLILIVVIIVVIIIDCVSVNNWKTKKLIRSKISILPFILAIFIFTGIIFYSKSLNNTNFSSFFDNWNNMKSDFEIVNDLVINYFENNNIDYISVHE